MAGGIDGKEIMRVGSNRMRNDGAGSGRGGNRKGPYFGSDCVGIARSWLYLEPVSNMSSGWLKTNCWSSWSDCESGIVISASMISS